MNDDVLRFLERVLQAGGVSVDVCDASSIDKAIIRGFEPGEVADGEAFAEAVLETCRLDAVGRTGRLRFELVATRDGKRWGRHSIVMDAGGAPAFGTDDANMAGIIVELIRDKRAVTQMAFAHTDAMFLRQGQMLELTQKQLVNAEEQRIKVFETLEQLIDNKAKRDLDASKQASDQRTQAKMIESVTPLIPAALNKLLGFASGKPNLLGGKALTQFMKSLTEDQMVTIAQTLDPAQQAALFQIAEAAEEEAKKDAQGPAGLLVENGTSAAHARADNHPDVVTVPFSVVTPNAQGGLG